MSNLIIPGQQPVDAKPVSGIQVATYGDAVLLQISFPFLLTPEMARGVGNAMLAAADRAEGLGQAVRATITGNGEGMPIG